MQALPLPLPSLPPLPTHAAVLKWRARATPQLADPSTFVCPKCSIVANDGPVDEGPAEEKKKRRKTKTPEVLTLGKTLDFVHDIIEKKILADITETESGQQPRSMTYFMRNYFIMAVGKGKLAKQQVESAPPLSPALSRLSL